MKLKSISLKDIWKAERNKNSKVVSRARAEQSSAVQLNSVQLVTQTSRKPMIELRDVWKVYKMGQVKVPALRGLTMAVYSKEAIIIMGASGSGKSTAMHLIGCLDKPTRGTVKLDGRDITTLDESRLAQIRGRKIGFVFQKFNLLPSLNALENVMLPMTFQGRSEAYKKKRAMHLLRLVGLENRITHLPSELSGGEQQRIAIARALANDPEIILADEPTGNLDSVTGKKILSLLDELHKKEGKTLIVVTHDLKMSKRIHGGKIYNLKDGVIVK